MLDIDRVQLESMRELRVNALERAEGLMIPVIDGPRTVPGCAELGSKVEASTSLLCEVSVGRLMHSPGNRCVTPASE